MQDRVAQLEIGADGINGSGLSIPISYEIWDKKYRFKTDETIEDTWWRVAYALAEAEKKEVREEWAQKFYGILKGFKFLPGGRILAGAGTGRRVTLFNCLAGGEMLFTQEHGLIQISQVAGQQVTVLTKKGWAPASVQKFGMQPIQEISFAASGRSAGGRSKYRQRVKATPNHRWILANGWETTDLKVGDAVAANAANNIDDMSPDYAAGLRHGLVFGDGSLLKLKSRISWQLRLCGERKKSFIPVFAEADNSKISYPPSNNGDPFITFDCVINLKIPPEPDCSDNYHAGFIDGWIASDGHRDAHGSLAISTQNAAAVEWLIMNAPRGGWIVTGRHFATSQFTNYGKRKNPLHFLHLRKVDTVFWTVKDIRPAGEAEVYCAVVPGERAFTLGAGIYTGNCYVSGEIEDSMPGIFEKVRESALTLQQGGGIGHDFSTIRPKGAPVKGVEADASGPVSFMHVWDSMCRTIMSAGSRRGAMMSVLRCDHPDVEEFIDAKRDPAKLRMFNVSVAVTDDFMNAVSTNAEWPLRFDGKTYKTLNARELWHKILRSTYETAEPGVIFIDRVNKLNNLQYCESIHSSNPCGEQMLPSYGACLLGSLNLAAFVKSPFIDRAALDIEKLREVTKIAVRLLDNVVDVSNYPLPQQEAEAKAKRRIGIGITGLADALAMCGFKYNSEGAQALASTWMANLSYAAYDASAELGKEKGSFPLFDPEKWKARSPGLNNFRTAAMRNSHLISIAPTGTISLLAGNVSSGIEPIFDLKYERKVLQPNGSRKTEVVQDYAFAKWTEDLEYPEYQTDVFVTAQDLKPEDHLLMMAAVAPYVDSAISKTINVPESISFEDFEQVYTRAYELGLKGCTTYRPNEITGNVISVAKKEVAAATIRPSPRPDTLSGKTYKLTWPSSPAFYVTINNHENGHGVKPYEIFVNSKNMQAYPWIVALTRMVSAIWRNAIEFDLPSDFVQEELCAVFDPNGGAWTRDGYSVSIVAAIGSVIERHCAELRGQELDISAERKTADMSSKEAWEEKARALNSVTPKLCQKCVSGEMVLLSGCWVCKSCGHSTCG